MNRLATLIGATRVALPRLYLADNVYVELRQTVEGGLDARLVIGHGVHIFSALNLYIERYVAAVAYLRGYERLAQRILALALDISTAMSLLNEVRSGRVKNAWRIVTLSST